MDHLVIFFREQCLSPDELLAFARRIGEPVEYPFVKGLDTHPEIIAVTKLPHETVNFGGIWHSDTAYLERPPMAHDAARPRGPRARRRHDVREHVRRVRDALAGDAAAARRHAGGQQLGARGRVEDREDRIRDQGGADDDQQYLAEHPVVRTHPETGRKALYVNPAHTASFADLTEAESRPLLEYLFQHSTRPEFTCRFRWEVGSLALWDNRCTMHNPINDYHGYTRVMHRITLAGDVPR